MNSINKKCTVLENLTETTNYFKYIPKSKLDGNFKNFFMMKWFIENFLSDKTGNFLVIGFSPGITTFLCGLEYPDVIFHVFDPQNYFKNLDNLYNVIIHKRLFTKDDALTYSKMKDLIVYSDLRTSYGYTNLNEDIDNQQELVSLINADYSMLKYKLSEYNKFIPAGYKIIQPFSKHTFEVRIIQKRDNYNDLILNDTNFSNWLKRKLNQYNILRLNDETIDIKIIQKMFGWTYRTAEYSTKMYEYGIKYLYFLFRTNDPFSIIFDPNSTFSRDCKSPFKSKNEKELNSNNSNSSLKRKNEEELIYDNIKISKIDNEPVLKL